jgi:hypothetical protein
MPGPARARTRDLIIVGIQLLGLLSGIVLVITGGGTGAPEDAEPRLTLPDDASLEAIEDWAGLAFPEGTEQFRTVRPAEGQLDLTFTMPVDAESAFLEGSGLPDLVPGERQVLHSSPLWPLNAGAGADPEDGSGEGSATSSTTSTSAPDGTAASTSSTTSVPQPEIRGAFDRYEDVRRAVEVVEESPGTLRARVVLSAIG